MKTTSILKSTMVAALLSANFIASAGDKVIPYSQTPSSVKTYISTHFPNYKVLKVETDNDILYKEYEVFLSNGIKIEFDGKEKSIKNIGGQTKLPESIMSKKVRDYVKKNYSDNSIVEYNLENNGISVELSNGIELKFSTNGDFLRIDD